MIENLIDKKMPQERLERIVSDVLSKDFDSISAVQYAEKLGHEIELQPHYSGNVSPLMTLLDAARTQRSKDHINKIYEAVADASQASIDKAVELMAEYEFIHYIRVHLQTGSQIPHNEFHSSIQDPSSKIFYHDSPDLAIRELTPEESKEKKKVIGVINTLYALEAAYVNALSLLIYWSDTWMKNMPSHDYGGKDYHEDMADTRRRLLEDPSKLEEELFKDVKKFLRHVGR